MSAQAMGLTSVECRYPIRTKDILALSNGLQMVWIDASWCFAEMI